MTAFDFKRIGLVLVLAWCWPVVVNADINKGSHSQQQPDASSESFAQLSQRAREAMAANRIPEAIQLYESAVRMHPSWSEGWWHLGTMFFDEGRYPAAHDAFVHFVSAERNEPGPGFAMLGLSDFHLKQYADALDALERGKQLGLGNNPDFIHSVLYYDGILNNLLGKPEIALQRFTLVANLISAAHQETSEQAVLDDSELLDAFGMAGLRISKLPAAISPTQAPMVRIAGRAQALIAMQDRVAADTEFQQLVALYPSQPGVHYAYGVFLLKEHPPLAIGEFRRELEVSPSSDAPRIQLALEYLRIADYDQGLKYASEAVTLSPKNFVAHVAYGKLLLGVGKTDHAVQELRTAVRLAPGSPDARFALSQAFARAGQNAQAAHERAEFERLKALIDAADPETRGRSQQ